MQSLSKYVEKLYYKRSILVCKYVLYKPLKYEHFICRGILMKRKPKHWKDFKYHMDGGSSYEFYDIWKRS